MSARNIGKVTWWGLVLASLVICGLVLWRQKALSIVYADGQPLIVETAATKTAQEKGLSGRTDLQKGHGMLFTFSGQSTQSCIWMKDMRLNIDAYWFNQQGRLISSKKALTPESFPQLYCPEIPAAYLLEVPAGQFVKTPKYLTLPDYQ